MRDAFEAGLGMPPKIHASLSKIDNGYAITFIKNDVQPPPEEVVAEGTDPELSEDEQVDIMVDGLQSFFRAIHGESESGDWRGQGEREKVRKALKLMKGGGGLGRYRTATVAGCSGPDVKQLVFESKAKLLEFLDKNL